MPQPFPSPERWEINRKVELATTKPTFVGFVVSGLRYFLISHFDCDCLLLPLPFRQSFQDACKRSAEIN